MTSLRARLTFSYAALFALVLIALSVLVTRLVFGIATQATTESVALAAARAPLIAAEHPDDDRQTIGGRIKRDLEHPGIVVMVPMGGAPPGPAPIYDPRNPGAIPPGRPPQRDAMQSAMRSFSVLGALGLRERPVRLPHNGFVMIAPDLHVLEPTIRLYFESLIAAVVLSILIAWLVARWIAAQAIAPLITVTSELRRFAAGDFVPRAVSTRDRSEIGDLTDAFNGAAAQVAAAFDERVRVEEQMRRFAADAGHELRTPLTVVSGFIDVLEKGGVTNPGIRERAFRTLRVETLRMRRLVERLMALAKLDRPDAVELETVDVAEIAGGAVAEALAARRGDVTLTVAPGGALILGDAGELHEAIGNLVDNALKYGAGSAVAVAVEHDGDRVRVRVSDAGPGIPPDERAHIFERFFRGGHTAGVEGSGLGLAIVLRAAERCGGTVRLEDGAGAGTIFVLDLPARTAPSAAEPALVL